ncbi:GTPase-activating protein CdGAPr isoform X2 [Atheta coriaria]
MHLANNTSDTGCSSGGSGIGGGAGAVGMVSGPSSLVDAGHNETCRFPKLEECAHFHYERVQLPAIAVSIQANMERSLHSQHTQDEDGEWYMVQVTSGDECWLLQRTFENFRLLDSQLHQCIYDRKISQLPDLSLDNEKAEEALLVKYLRRFTTIADNSINCGPVLNWLQMDNKGHRLLVPSEESRSINTPAVAAAYSVRRYVSQARDELNLEVGDMISVIDMASPGESIWWRGKRGFQVGFFPQHCVHIIGDKVPRNMPLPAPVVGSLALSPIKPVLRKHGKLIAFFRSFILNRPSRRRLKQSGILRERVFGCDLGEHLGEGSDIPTVLKCCAEFIETHGIVDGIYRLSGVTSNIQKLRNAFDEDRIPDLFTEDILQDIHSVASLLKMYFRELPNPLCTYQLYQSFVQAVQGCTSMRNTHNDHERLLKMREAVQKLPPPHYRTLEYLARHLAKVAKHGDRTGMTVRNVAIVWAPNLLRSAELEVGGVAALQGVGVQAVVTEFLICYADLIFCDNLNAKLNVSDLDAAMQQAALLNAASPKRSRPKSLAISTPTKLITLEEARNKHHKDAYIEVGGGPDSLPKKYHTIIDLPMRKRVNSKRSPLGWRSLFGKSRNRQKPTIVHHVVNTEQVDASSTNGNTKPEVKIVLRTVKSAESLSDLDQLPPLQNVLCTKPPGHNRSVSHDSYFDTLQSSQEGSLLDLSEIQVNFDLEESEMRIFSEDESLVSSPRVQPRRIRISSGNNSGNPSPKKQPRVILSPDSASRKRTRLEEQLSDIQFIDCNTPEMICGSTIVQVHQTEGPRNKSPRNSQCLELRDYNKRDSRLSQVMMTSTSTVTAGTPQSPTPQSPTYKLLESSTGTTPGDISPQYLSNLSKAIAPLTPVTSVASTPLTPTPKSPKSPSYDNVLTTISITYKSPTKTKSFLTDERVTQSPNYETVLVKAEDAQIPTSTANLPLQAASTRSSNLNLNLNLDMDFSASMTNMSNSMSTINDIHDDLQKEDDCDVHLLSTSLDALESVQTDDRTSLNLNLNEDEDSFPKCDTTLSELLDSYDRIAKATSGDWSHVETEDLITDTQDTQDLQGVDENRHYENVKSSNSSDDTSNCLVNYENINFTEGMSSNGDNENVESYLGPPEEDLIEFSPVVEEVQGLQAQEKRKQSPQGADEQDHDVYQQVKYFRRSVHELNEFIALTHQDTDTNDESYENVDVAKVIEIIEPEEQEDSTSIDEDEIKIVENVTEHTQVEVQNLVTKFPEPETFDSLETNDYETIEFTNDSLEADVEKSVNDDVIKVQITTDVINLPETEHLNDIDVAMMTASKEDVMMTITMSTVDEPSPSPPLPPPEVKISPKVKQLTSKFEVQDVTRPVPPCIRARNLKASKKTTRSLDETEFLKNAALPVSTNAETNGESSTQNEDGTLFRRKSLDENMCGFKTNTLPKTLNKPKKLPDDPDIGPHVVPHDVNVNLNRERIEKYKEERRKFFNDKYKSESFKENKDVLLSRLKVFKPPTKEEEAVVPVVASLNVMETQIVHTTANSPEKKVANGVKARTAIFENDGEVEMRPGSVSSRRQKVTTAPPAAIERELTESSFEQARRSFEPAPTRKDRSSTSYCIKDMKAIFESKSQQ